MVVRRHYLFMMIEDQALDLLLGRRKLTENESDVEGNTAVESSEPVEEKQLENEVIAEGQIPQDASGVTSENFDGLSQSGYIDVSFESGNLPQVEQLPEMMTDKLVTLKKTFIPLVEKSLIELLGSSSMWARKAANIQAQFQTDGSVSLSGTLVYQVDMWIGLDVDPKDVAHDQKYVMNTLWPLFQSMKVSQLQIDPEDGTLTISFAM